MTQLHWNRVGCGCADLRRGLRLAVVPGGTDVPSPLTAQAAIHVCREGQSRSRARRTNANGEIHLAGFELLFAVSFQLGLVSKEFEN